jgi:hypothetical protein
MSSSSHHHHHHHDAKKKEEAYEKHLERHFKKFDRDHSGSVVMEKNGRKKTKRE